MEKHAREFIAFRSIQEERYNTIQRDMQEIKELLKKNEETSQAQASIALELNNRITNMEAELRTKRNFIATLLVITATCAGIIGTFVGLYLRSKQ